MNVFLSYAQENGKAGKIVRTEPNGVIVHEAAGVEGAQAITKKADAAIATERVAPSLTDLSVTELEERLNYIDKKLAHEKENGNDQEQLDIYIEQRKAVEERIKVVKNPK